LNPISASSIDPNEKPYVDTTTPEEDDNLMMGDEEFKEEMKMYGEQSKSSLLMSTTNAPRFNLYEDDYAEGDQEEDITLSG
jgi:hypothetical protein